MAGRMGDFSNLIPLTASERNSLLNAMDDEADVLRRSRDRRVHGRWTFRAPELLMVVEHPGGGLGKFRVQSRNLSAGGMGFLHGGYLHPGTCCRLLLPRLDGVMTPIAAIVATARHLRGVTHEIGVRFSRHIEPASFVEEANAARGDGIERYESRKLGGRALFVALENASQTVLTQSLEALSIEMSHVEDVDRAKQHIGNAAPDLMVIEFGTLSEASDAVIRQVREAAADAPLIVLTPDARGERIAAARAAGANYILPAPPPLNVLHPLVLRLGERTAGTHGPLEYGSRDGSTDARGDLFSVIETILDLAHRLEAAVADDRVRQAIDLCGEMRTAAERGCFASMLRLSDEALSELNRSRSIEVVRSALTALHAAAHRLGVHGTTTAGAEEPAPSERTFEGGGTTDQSVESARAA